MILVAFDFMLTFRVSCYSHSYYSYNYSYYCFFKIAVFFLFLQFNIRFANGSVCILSFLVLFGAVFLFLSLFRNSDLMRH
jgi:hypothetical protein